MQSDGFMSREIRSASTAGQAIPHSVLALPTEQQEQCLKLRLPTDDL
jgi:hypothetical protein